MIFLPIVERELRVAARRASTYWGRVLVALVALVFWLWVAVSSLASTAPSRRGMEMFEVLSLVAFGFALLAGAGRTSDSLSAEKREGTLGLLFLTDLKGYDVVIGKLAATSLAAIYGLLAVLPVLAMPLLMGGVAAAAFWRTVVVLLNTLFFSLACGMFASAISRHARKAMGATLLLTVVATGGLPLFGVWLQAQFSAGRLLQLCCAWPSPGYALFLASNDEPLLLSRAAEFWGSCVLTGLLSCLLVLLASRIAPRAWKDKPASVKRLLWRERWRNLILGNAIRRAAFRRRLLEINPIFWLSSRERQAVTYPWIFLGSMAAIWVWCWTIMRADWFEPGLALGVTFVLHAFMKYWVLVFTCNGFAADRGSGALELLLSTPLTVSDLLRGQWQALRRQFLRPMVATILFDLLWLGFALNTRPPPGGTFAPHWGLIFLLGIVAFALDGVTLAWVGLWLSASLKSASRATFVAMLRVLLLPSIVFGLLSVIMTLFGFFDSMDAGLAAVVIACLWFGIGLITDALYGPWAYWKLKNDLRATAAQALARSESGSGRGGRARPV